MKLRYITMSDPREDLPIAETLELLKLSPLAELGVQAHPHAMMYGLRRNAWFNNLMNSLENSGEMLNIALHINYQWCDDMCDNIIPYEVQNWLNRKNKKTGEPSIKRIQLNIGDGAYLFRPDKASRMIARFPDREFIFPYNERVANKMDALRKTGAKFSLLYDASYGAGVAPKTYEAPVWDNVNFGYAGGLSLDNVASNLNKINSVLPANYSTWIDAEGRLRSSTWGGLDLDKARQYLQNALAWQKKNQTR